MKVAVNTAKRYCCTILDLINTYNIDIIIHRRIKIRVSIDKYRGIKVFLIFLDK